MKRKYHLNFFLRQFPSEIHSYKLLYQMTCVFYESHKSRVQVKSRVSCSRVQVKSQVFIYLTWQVQYTGINYTRVNDMDKCP